MIKNVILSSIIGVSLLFGNFLGLSNNQTIDVNDKYEKSEPVYASHYNPVEYDKSIQELKEEVKLKRIQKEIKPNKEIKQISRSGSNTSFSKSELTALTKTLAGECYADQIQDKRKVAEVIVNRVSDGRFGDDVKSVVSAKGQFHGYYKQSRPISDSDVEVAKEVLNDWYSNNCKSISDYLYFHAGGNRQNIFRKKF